MRKAIVILSLLAGCSSVPTIPYVTPYKIDIQQGNYVTQDMVAKLKPGMTRSQVRFVLGTPLVVDMFHQDRWDYVYVYRKAGEVTEHRKMTVIFEGDKLARLEGDVVPAKPAKAAPAGATEKAKPAPGGVAPGPAPAATGSESAPGGPPPAQADGKALTTTSGRPVATGAPDDEPVKSGAEAKKSKAEDAKRDAPAEEKGFFGRMLDKLGL